MDLKAHFAMVVPVRGCFLMLSSCTMVKFLSTSLQTNPPWHKSNNYGWARVVSTHPSHLHFCLLLPV